MRLISIFVLFAMLALPSQLRASTMSFHDFEFTSIEGKALPASTFAGKAVLVVNTASECGFTKQYTALQNVYEQYRDQGLIVLGVPSNDFGGQEPGSEAEIKEFVKDYNVKFLMFGKIEVNGPG